MDLNKTGTENHWSKKEQGGSRDQTGTGLEEGAWNKSSPWAGEGVGQTAAIDEEPPSLQGTRWGMEKG